MRKRALIIGVTGGFGHHVAHSLLRRGWDLTVLVRDENKVGDELHAVRKIVGDAANVDDVRRASVGVDLMVYGLNVPYEQWHKSALLLLETALSVAVEHKLKVVFPGNVYNFDPAEGPVFAEGAPQHPQTRKGLIRRKMEDKLKEAGKAGASVLVVRAGDFFGWNGRSTWFGEIVKNNRVAYPGSLDLPHSWAYLPDLGECIGMLLENSEKLENFEEFHFSGHEFTGRELLETLNRIDNGKYRVSWFPWWIIKIGGLFSSFLRELVEMRYLWQWRVTLKSDRLMQILPEVPHTPLDRALKASLN